MCIWILPLLMQRAVVPDIPPPVVCVMRGDWKPVAEPPGSVLACGGAFWTTTDEPPWLSKPLDENTVCSADTTLYTITVTPWMTPDDDWTYLSRQFANSERSLSKSIVKESRATYTRSPVNWCWQVFGDPEIEYTQPPLLSQLRPLVSVADRGLEVMEGEEGTLVILRGNYGTPCVSTIMYWHPPSGQRRWLSFVWRVSEPDYDLVHRIADRLVPYGR